MKRKDDENLSDECKSAIGSTILAKAELNREERALKMLKRHLQGATYEDIAKEFGYSVTTVSRIAKEYDWAQFSQRRRRRRLLQVLREVEREERKRNGGDLNETPYGPDAEEAAEGWYWEMKIQTQPGVNPLGPIPPDPRCCRIIEENETNGIYRIEYFAARIPGAKPRWEEAKLSW